MIRRAAAALCLALLLAMALGVAAQVTRNDADLPPAPPKHFIDSVGLVDPGAARQFATDLYEFEQRTDIQFVVAILPRYSGSLEDYVNRLFEHWGVGQVATQRGVLFVIFPEQKKTRLEVGYGLEEYLPDITAGRILKKMLRLSSPAAEDRIDFVIRQVALAVAPDDPLAQGAEPLKSRSGDKDFDRALLIGLVIFVIFVIVLGLVLARRTGPVVYSSGKKAGSGFWGGVILGGGSSWGGGSGGGGGGFGGGGFSGGGGFGGGGGASGGW